MSAVLVAVALRHTDPRAGADPLTGRIHRDPYAGGASPADRCALEHALRLARTLDARCLAVTVGGAEADPLLREALAAGADEVLRVEGADEDGASTARSLYDGLVARGGPLPEVIVCGDRSTDRGAGTVPAYLAHLTGASQALGLTALTTENGELRATRRLDAGRRELLALTLPAVCSVERSGVRLRRAPLPATLAARRADVPVVTVSTAPDAAVTAGPPRPYRPRPRVLPAPRGREPRERLLALTGAGAPPRDPPRVATPDTPAEAAGLLLDYLRERSYLP
ncbi:mycofactocin-associated electron transfer flavoprotein beta subunit [Streptomyces sp. NPDC047065]|uniref:mycofactocin-associated electron transfer flavoprotein beta subunit n=1 Tax=Streptomyces sp. NPDC047065 TaxID=3154606 RepID=UPI0033DA054A